MKELSLEEKQEVRRQRYLNSLPLLERIPSVEVMACLQSQGLADKNGFITDAGRLVLHQLELLKWINDHQHA